MAQAGEGDFGSPFGPMSPRALHIKRRNECLQPSAAALARQRRHAFGPAALPGPRPPISDVEAAGNVNSAIVIKDAFQSAFSTRWR
jgi:hypothetical protein